jgi:hypothetical protein
VGTGNVWGKEISDDKAAGKSKAMHISMKAGIQIESVRTKKKMLGSDI